MRCTLVEGEAPVATHLERNPSYSNARSSKLFPVLWIVAFRPRLRPSFDEEAVQRAHQEPMGVVALRGEHHPTISLPIEFDPDEPA